MTNPRTTPQVNQERHWEQIPDVFGNVENISDTLVVREQNQFLLTDGDGEIPSGSKRGLGLYSNDARHLAVYELLVDGYRPLVLLSTAASGFSQEQVLGNHHTVQNGLDIGRCTIEIKRERVINGSLEETLRFTNYNPFPVTVHPTYAFAADFADIFEVRGHKRRKRGTLSPPEVGERSICYRYLGVDGVWRRTMIEFAQKPGVITAGGAGFELTLETQETQELRFTVLLEEHAKPDRADALHKLREDYDSWHESFAHVRTDNESFNTVLSRSLSDLRMLWTKDHHGDSYLAAGIPWFGTLFGRDSIISSLQTLPFRPDIARSCLGLLARHQGQFVDQVRCEEPGKILHEMRQDELSRIGELPYERYYGSVDSTPLFLILAAEYYHWTADREFISGLMPAIHNALHWLKQYGDPDQDGFFEYATDSVDGLRNQGWKDSVAAIMHTDGSLCDGPIALAEVQGYVHTAYRRLAPVLDALGDKERAAELRKDARELRRKFVQSFWSEDRQQVAMALDGQKRPSQVMSSNAGQVLWGGMLNREQAGAVRDSLFNNDMFSGWGIRTLSNKARTYNPLGYHVGTVWPHDNGIIAMGLKRYGFEDEVNEIATSLLDAAHEFPAQRLPELFGGQSRSEFQPPVPYPVACRPQAWTAGTHLHLLQAMLGLFPDALNKRLYVVRPRLPYWLRNVDLRGLAVGRGRANLHFYQDNGKTSVAVETTGSLDVIVGQGTRRYFQDA